MGHYLAVSAGVLFYLALPTLILCIPVTTPPKTPNGECRFAACINPLELSLVFGATFSNLTVSFLSVRYALFRDGLLEATGITVTFLALCARFGVPDWSSLIQVIPTLIISLSVACWVVVQLRLYAKAQADSESDPLFAPFMQDVAGKVFAALWDRVEAVMIAAVHGPRPRRGDSRGTGSGRGAETRNPPADRDDSDTGMSESPPPYTKPQDGPLISV
ncbi:hypothetical protein FB451DRAFT_1214626 [Mycena latifolia]|nr:hypothetical protein FB451DRAFT_1214626 [Mycena latifolia]